MITLKSTDDFIITISGRNLKVFDFLEDKIMPVQKYKSRVVNYNFILKDNGEHR